MDKLNSKESNIKSFIEDTIEVKEDQSENNIIININMKTDKESFEVFKKKLIDLIDNKEFRILTKDKFIEWYISKNSKSTNTKRANVVWERVRKGYNFIILAGVMMYSVPYFNEMFKEK